MLFDKYSYDNFQIPNKIMPKIEKMAEITENLFKSYLSYLGRQNDCDIINSNQQRQCFITEFLKCFARIYFIFYNRNNCMTNLK